MGSNLGSVMGAIMQVGIPVYQNGVFRPRAGRKGLLEIAKPIASHKDGNLLPLWELYIAAYRANRLIKEKNPLCRLAAPVIVVLALVMAPVAMILGAVVRTDFITSGYVVRAVK